MIYTSSLSHVADKETLIHMAHHSEAEDVSTSEKLSSVSWFIMLTALVLSCPALCCPTHWSRHSLAYCWLAQVKTTRKSDQLQ